MGKVKYGKKVLKTIVSHRTCGTCNWWKHNRPGQPVRKHRCVHTCHKTGRGSPVTHRFFFFTVHFSKYHTNQFPPILFIHMYIDTQDHLTNNVRHD